MSHLVSASLVAVLVLVPAGAHAQDVPDSASEGPARQLATLLDASGAPAIAARIPETPDRYVAALKSGSMLLVVGGRYAQPVLLNEQIWGGRYEEVYRTLVAASERDGKLFVQDMGADGLQPVRSATGAFDIVFENVSERTVFDGDFESRDLSREEYHDTFSELDRRYADLLQVLVTAMDEPAPVTSRRD